MAGVTSVASTAASIVGQMQSAKAQNKAIEQQAEAVAEENRLSASADMFERDRAARREQSRIRTAAGEAGLVLNSGAIENLLMDSAMQNELANDRTLANRESRDKANIAEANSMYSKVQSPTALGAGLQIGASAASAWSGVRDAQMKVKVEKAKTKKAGYKIP
ncbi:virion core protein, T7 gp14 family [Sphingobium sp. EP60837]|uniref:virion core protein, T7 gp14 family n=1 Tax=Sphingobium sp. EP60837 TaxID=1855519 RepID=UPI0012E833C7|nr:hypothetical protein [Sphingobium sp. EP60837]